MKISLNISHTNRLFTLTEKHMNWFSVYYSNSIPEFSNLLKRNYNILAHYCIIELYNEYEDKDIHYKLDKMYEAYENLQEITMMNKNIISDDPKEIH